MESPYYVYLLEATASTGRITTHVGIAINVHKRLDEHRAGKVKQTRGREVTLLGLRGPYSKPDALRLEAAWKKLTPIQRRAMVGL